ncbi:hypothetical protein Pcinc_032803 [Petrolisthes cinctipes]|uniref:Uncharacterized protein n=1 Tax=Petrolisthes cinctipes TaxID=88211 RepID=A0AAE1ETR9_PETCI|nr:hypothetical protein Pcinc_032803 [Petrolisthes cinctipes]
MTGLPAGVAKGHLRLLWELIGNTPPPLKTAIWGKEDPPREPHTPVLSTIRLDHQPFTEDYIHWCTQTIVITPSPASVLHDLKHSNYINTLTL